MRIFTFVIIVYAFLSLFAPYFKTITAIDTTGLLFYRPWSYLSALFEPDMVADSPPRFRIPSSRDSMARVWWNPVFLVPRSARDSALIGARCKGRISSSGTRFLYFVGDSSLIRQGDPVVRGQVIIGFVGEFHHPSEVPVFLLNDPASRAFSIVGKVSTIAGGEVRFVVGGPAPKNRDKVGIRIVENPYSLVDGSVAFTAKESSIRGIPPGFEIGAISRTPHRENPLRESIGIVPSYEGIYLDRVAVLVPRDRISTGERYIVPPLPLERVHADLRIWGGNPRHIDRIRFSAGLESRLCPGDLLVSNNIALGRLDRIGLWVSSASLLIEPGRMVEAAVLMPEEKIGFIQMEIISRKENVFEVRSDKKLSELERGSPVYMREYPCSGLEEFPLGFVENPGDGIHFHLEVPGAGMDSDGFCLKFSENPL